MQASAYRDKHLFKPHSPAALAGCGAGQQGEAREAVRERLLSDSQTGRPVTWPHNLTLSGELWAD